MQKSEFETGGLAIQTYASAPGSRIVEIGVGDLGKTLRPHVGPEETYIGVGLKAGPGIDVVAKLGSPLPLDDESCDLVMASSVFDRDPAFWVTFLEMIRIVRKGGYIYFNAPSNGTFHLSPQDQWRFYPDSSLALERWAGLQGWPVQLIESFSWQAPADPYSNFVAIFRRMPGDGALPVQLVHSAVDGYNVRTWQSDSLINPRDESLDSRLATAAKAGAEQEKSAHARTQAELEEVRRQLAAVQQRTVHAETLTADLTAAKDRLHHLESELRQRQEEIAQYRGELDAARSAATEAADIQAKLAESEQWVADLARFRADAQKQIAALKRQLARSNDVEGRTAAQLRDGQRQIAELKDMLGAQEAEIGRLRLCEEQLTLFGDQQQRLYEESDRLLRQAQVVSTTRLDEVQNLSRQITNLDEAARTAAAKITMLERQVADREEQAQTAAAEIVLLEGQLAAQNAIAQATAAEKRALEKRIVERENDLFARSAELTSLRVRVGQQESDARAQMHAMDSIKEQHSRDTADYKNAIAAKSAQIDDLRIKSERETALRTLIEGNLRTAADNLTQAEARLSEAEVRAAEKDWLRHVHIVLASRPFWWILMPASWRRMRERKLLLAAGLFDAERYLAHYPDVVAEGMEPLRHYIWHGMTEGRRRRFD